MEKAERFFALPKSGFYGNFKLHEKRVYYGAT